jgi:hypothetical protein
MDSKRQPKSDTRANRRRRMAQASTSASMPQLSRQTSLKSLTEEELEELDAPTVTSTRNQNIRRIQKIVNKYYPEMDENYSKTIATNLLETQYLNEPMDAKKDKEIDEMFKNPQPPPEYEEEQVFPLRNETYFTRPATELRINPFEFLRNRD